MSKMVKVSGLNSLTSGRLDPTSAAVVANAHYRGGRPPRVFAKSADISANLANARRELFSNNFVTFSSNNRPPRSPADDLCARARQRLAVVRATAAGLRTTACESNVAVVRRSSFFNDCPARRSSFCQIIPSFLRRLPYAVGSL